MGLCQHQRKAHPEEYHMKSLPEMRAPATTSQKITPEERRLLTTSEATLFSTYPEFRGDKAKMLRYEGVNPPGLTLQSERSNKGLTTRAWSSSIFSKSVPRTLVLPLQPCRIPCHPMFLQCQLLSLPCCQSQGGSSQSVSASRQASLALCPRSS